MPVFNRENIKCRLCGDVPLILKGRLRDLCPVCHVKEFFRTLCTHTKGKWAGSRFELLPWQLEDIIIPLFGTIKPNGYRQYRTCYVEIPKKNGKTELASGISLYMLVADDEQGGEVYSAAAEKEQAGLVYGPAAQMVRNNKTLDRRLTIIDSRKRIVDYRTNSFYHVLSREHYTKHGINPSAVIFDELHAQKTDELWNVLTSGTDYARQQQLIFAMSTAGIYDKNSIWWKIREKARRIKEGSIKNKSFLPVLYIADKELDNPADRKVWIRVNPSVGHIFTVDKIKEDFKEAKRDPVEYNNFLRYRLNIPVSQISRWMPMDFWDACGGNVDKGKLLKRLCFGGLDLSSRIDLTAFALLFPPEKLKEKWQILVKNYMPEDNIEEAERRDEVPYGIWVEAGLITATPGNVVDQNYIKKDVQNAAKIYSLREVGYDPWNSTKLAVELEEEDGITMVEMRQGMKTLSEPTKDLLVKTKGGVFAHGGNPVLRWNMDNLAVKLDENENVRPIKDKSRGRIDGTVALIMALGRAILHEDETSMYETEEVKVF